jgi:hypothetical protein
MSALKISLNQVLMLEVRRKRFDPSSAANHSGYAKGLVWLPRFTLRTVIPAATLAEKWLAGLSKDFFNCVFFN